MLRTFQRPMANKSSCHADNKPSGCGPDPPLLGEATLILHATYQNIQFILCKLIESNPFFFCFWSNVNQTISLVPFVLYRKFQSLPFFIIKWVKLWVLR